MKNPVEDPGPTPIARLVDLRSFFERLEEETALARRDHSPLSILLLEADNLTAMVDDDPVATELVLDQIAALLQGSLRLSDGLFQYDEDRFAAILPDTDLSAASVVAERGCDLLAAIAYQDRITISLDGSDGLSVSVGLAELDTAAPASALVAKAEGALRLARKSGGGTIRKADGPA